MDKEQIKNQIKEIETSIKQITNKTNKLLFFVADSKGTPIGSLSYIYGLAYTLQEMGYNVSMLYAEKEFVGVESWLGKKYANLKHYNSTKDIVDVAPGDVLFIPELYSSIMAQTKPLHCKKVAILQNYDYMTELIPFGASWEGMGVNDCIVTSKELGVRLNELFPNIKTYVIRPVIDECFANNNVSNKKLVVNVVTKDEKYINSIIKPFKWKHPEYGFVTFRYINGKPKEEFAKFIGEGTISVWIDNETDFGYSALEAMAAGNLVIGKIPENVPEWMVAGENKLADNGIWFYRMRELPDILANVIAAVLHEDVPAEITENINRTLSNYTKENQNKDIERVIVDDIIKNRKDELTKAKTIFKNNLETLEKEEQEKGE